MTDKKPWIAVAPMMDWTDRHCRAFHRLLSSHVWLYTEMVTTGALLHGDKDRFLTFRENEHPIALQLGGSDPDDLAACARLAVEYGYDEINLNCGCPSDRVQKGCFGAVLMKDAPLIATCIKAMRDVVPDTIPVTVKCRIGVDDFDGEDFLDDFMGTVAAQGGCTRFIVHARKAWLKGLSPKENREIPPLDYARVKKMKARHPSLWIAVNGGITSLAQTQEMLEIFDGIMIGRSAYQDPVLLSEIDQHFFGGQVFDPQKVIEGIHAYLDAVIIAEGLTPHSLFRHTLGLFNGQPGARRWRQLLGTSHALENPADAHRLLDEAFYAIR